MIKRNIWLGCVLLVVFAGCNSDDEDTTAPMIDALSVQPNEVLAGENLRVGATVSDNEALKQVKFEIHDLFDGHGHEKLAGTPWETVRIVDVGGKNAELTETFEVPEDATAGPYHAVLQVVDAAGNNGDLREVDFWVRNSDMAVIDVITPDMENGSYFHFGEILAFEGTVTDNDEIHEIVVVVESENGTVYYEEDVDLEGMGTDLYDLGDLPPLLFEQSVFGQDPLRLKIEITAVDSDENISSVEGVIHYN